MPPFKIKLQIGKTESKYTKKNVGIKMAEGKFIFLLHQDVKWPIRKYRYVVMKHKCVKNIMKIWN